MIEIRPTRIAFNISSFLCFICLMLLILYLTLKVEFFGSLLAIVGAMCIICCLMSMSLYEKEKREDNNKIYPIVKPIENVTIVTHTYPYHS